MNTNAIRPERATPRTAPSVTDDSSSPAVAPTPTARYGSGTRDARALATGTASSDAKASRAIWAASASGECPLTGHRTGPVSAGAEIATPCSSTRCALVPLIPNDDTAARRTRSAGHSPGSESSRTPDQSTCGVGVVACRVAGSTPCRTACTALTTPSTPAAACA